MVYIYGNDLTTNSHSKECFLYDGTLAGSRRVLRVVGRAVAADRHRRRRLPSAYASLEEADRTHRFHHQKTVHPLAEDRRGHLRGAQKPAPGLLRHPRRGTRVPHHLSGDEVDDVHRQALPYDEHLAHRLGAFELHARGHTADHPLQRREERQPVRGGHPVHGDHPAHRHRLAARGHPHLGDGLQHQRHHRRSRPLRSDPVPGRSEHGEQPVLGLRDHYGQAL